VTNFLCWHDAGPDATLPETGSRAFSVPCGKTELAGFLVRRNGELRAFRNRCPHTGVELNWGGDAFLDVTERFVLCSMHGALFQPEDGLCVHGPCVGRSLQTLPVRIREGRVEVACPEAKPSASHGFR